MMFGKKSQGNQRRQEFFLTNWKYGLPKLEKKFKKGKEIVEVWCYVGLECLFILILELVERLV
jgi:hypothetical protein